MTTRIAAFAIVLATCAGAGVVATGGGAIAAEHIAGPVPAAVERVIDGDTLVVSAHIWPGLAMRTNVRVRGIDTPEVHRPKCASEKEMGLQATGTLNMLVGDEVVLTDIANDKYGGRVDAVVTTADGRDVAAAMLASGLARPYDGATRGDWCATGSIR